MRNVFVCTVLALCLLMLAACGNTTPDAEPATAITEPTAVTQAVTEPVTEPVIPSTEAPVSEEPLPEETEAAAPAGSMDPALPLLAPPEVSDEPCHYFDDAAFIGDSLSYSLLVHNTRTKDLGNALFLVKGSLGLFNTLNHVMDVHYQGTAMTPWDALAASGVSKVFLMLGMNDIGYYGIDETIENWDAFVKNIREVCPDIQIVIQSLTPVWHEASQSMLTNENVDLYNQRLQEFAEANDCVFLNIAPYFKDGHNGLAAAYCSDEYVHMNFEGTSVWAKVLKAYAAETEKETP